MPVSMAMSDMWVGSPITWQGWRARRGEAAQERRSWRGETCNDRSEAQSTHERRQGQRHACQCPWLCLTCGWGAPSHGKDGERGKARLRRRGGAGEAKSVMTGAKLRAHTSVGKGRDMHASVHGYV
jgi:hypothetical protein